MTGPTNGTSNGANGTNAPPQIGTDRVKQGLAQMLKGGVIVSITTNWYPSYMCYNSNSMMIGETSLRLLADGAVLCCLE